ncbi:hypothetical protein CANARDRAFT_28637 [[Candida] arabinofermentans NRRL YB-2248]|uniref:Uncharacterized protein n=1 Tax=[Candida] arabinofermentans NRRL YB-2248 TaxID=983967 RepID=A0A1E4SZG0_9ASCO|nr:hypothetical protein CANARDRAFT_28637 [[Candida] arabinofermentans NRRL YB-2248]
MSINYNQKFQSSTTPIFKNYVTLKGHYNKVLSISWHPDNVHIVTAAQDGFLIVWDSTTGFKKSLIQLDDPWITSTDISPNGELIATGGLEDACIVYKLYTEPNNNQRNSKSTVSIFKGHQEYISDLSFMSNNTIITSSGDRSLIHWDINKGQKTRTFYGHLGDVLSVSVHPLDTQNIFISSSSDRFVNVWDVRVPMKIRSFQTSITHDCSSLKFFPDGNSFSVGCDDGSLKLFDLRSDCQIGNYGFDLVHKKFGVPRLNQIEKGQLINSSSILIDDNHSSSGLISINSSMIAALDNPGVLSIDFSKSGRLMFVSYADYSNVVVWDTITGQIVNSLDGHKDVISKVQVSKDGLGIATGSRDSLTKIWSI